MSLRSLFRRTFSNLKIAVLDSTDSAFMAKSSRHFHKTGRARASSLAAADLRLSTDRAQLDEKVEISVHGLQEGQKVTLHTFVQNGDKTYGSCGHYVADGQGEVNTFKHPSLGGTFTGLESMGLFWSLDNQPGEKKARFLAADPTLPYEFTVCAQEGFVDFHDLPWSGDFSEILHQRLDRHHVAPGTRRIPVEQDGIYGTLFLPPGDGPFPGILDIYGLVGGIKEHRAALLSRHGFATFALAYINYKDLPVLGLNSRGADLTLFLRAFDWLSSHPSVDSSAMGCLASCVGGGFGLLTTAMRPGVRCLAMVNGLSKPEGVDESVEVEGERFGCMCVRPEKLTFDEHGRIRFRELFKKDKSIPVPPAWRHGAKCLFVVGEDDQCVNPDSTDEVMESFPEEFKDNYSTVWYPGAGHLIEPPFQPLSPMSYNKIYKNSFSWGGELVPHCYAQEDAWTRIVDFFQNNLHAQKDSVRAKL